MEKVRARRYESSLGRHRRRGDRGGSDKFILMIYKY